MLYPETLYVDFGYKESPPLKCWSRRKRFQFFVFSFRLGNTNDTKKNNSSAKLFSAGDTTVLHKQTLLCGRYDCAPQTYDERNSHILSYYQTADEEEVCFCFENRLSSKVR